MNGCVVTREPGGKLTSRTSTGGTTSTGEEEPFTVTSALAFIGLKIIK